MRTPTRTAFTTVVALVLLGFGNASRAQDHQDHPLERIVRVRTLLVGPGVEMFGSLYAAMRSVGVPFGFEQVRALAQYTVAVDPARDPKEVKVSGLTVRAALDAIVAVDPRYEWRYLDGVVVMRPVAAWNAPAHPLAGIVPSVHLVEVTGRQTVDALKAVTGHPGPPVTGFPRTHRFSVAFDGGPLIDLLDAIVKAHGEMAWSLISSVRPSNDKKSWTFQPSLSLLSPLGHGMEIHGALLEPEAPIPPGIFIRGDSAPELDTATARDRLDMLLPPSVTEMRAKGLTHLARSLGVPSGFEEAGALKQYVSKPFRNPGGVAIMPTEEIMVPVAGLTLRQALDAYVAVDRRYGWQEMNGVVVMRPTAAWGRGEHPLEATTGAVRLRDARISEAFDALRRAVASGSAPPALPFGDEKRVSVDFAGGRVLDLANAIVRSYGQLSWSLSSNEFLMGLDRSTAVWVIEPDLTLETESAGMGIPLRGR